MYPDSSSPRHKQNGFDLPSLALALVLATGGLLCYYGFRLYDHNVLVASTDFVPTDGITYQILSTKIEYILDELDFIGLMRGLLNWATIPLILYMLEGVLLDGGAIFIVINSFAIAFSMQRVRSFLSDDKPYGWFFVIAILLTQPYIFSYILIANKDLLAVYFLAQITFNIYKENTFATVIWVCIATIFKTQFLAAYVFYLIYKKFNQRIWVVLLFLSLFYPIYVSLGLGVDLDEFVQQAPDEVKSAAVMTFLQNIAQYPLGMIVVSPLRLVLNMLVGLSLGRWVVSTTFVDYVSAWTSIAAGAIVVIYFLWFRRNSLAIFHSLKHKYAFPICYALAITMVPFLQTRYYWCLVPFLLIYFIDSTKFIDSKRL